MKTSPSDTITIQVRTLAELFSEPVRDPWRDGPDPLISGVEQVLQSVRKTRAANVKKLRIEVAHTLDSYAPLVSRTPLAWKNHCLSLAKASQTEGATLHKRAWRIIFSILPWMIGALSLSAFFDHVHPLPDVLNRLFSEGLVIIGWVMLWHPVEMLIFDSGEPRVEARLLEKLANLEVEVVDHEHLLKSQHSFSPLHSSSAI